MKKTWFLVLVALLSIGCAMNSKSKLTTWADTKLDTYTITKAQVAVDCEAGTVTHEQCDEMTAAVCAYEKIHNFAFKEYGKDKNEWKLKATLETASGNLSNTVYKIRGGTK